MLNTFSAVSTMALLRNNIVCQFCRNRIQKATWKKLVLLMLVLIVFFTYMQINFRAFHKWFLEKDFREGFNSFPVDAVNFKEVVKRYILEKTHGNITNFQPSPINAKYSKVGFLHGATSIFSNDIHTTIGLLIIVKSATKNYRKRMAIRKTWGDPNYLAENFISEDFPTKLAFICGLPGNHNKEKKYGDIILANFTDAYGKNTYKTLLLMRWALEQVKQFKYLMIVDDDMYFNPKNVINFIKNIPEVKVRTIISGGFEAPVFYPESQVRWIDALQFKLKGYQTGGELVSLKDESLIMGFLNVDSTPFRNSAGPGSKWFVSVNEYPYNYFPPYVAGGATLIDSATVAFIYYGSLFTEDCSIDDVYIGILARKLGIALTNSDRIDSTYRDARSKLRHRLEDMIAIHGLDCPEQLIEIWNTKNLHELHDCSQISHLL